jgi:hypothetical protein
MNSEWRGEADRRDAELARLRLVGRTLQTENDFLREEVELLRGQQARQARGGRDEKAGVAVDRQAEAGHYSLAGMEATYDRLRNANQQLREGAGQRPTSRLAPAWEVDEDQELGKLRAEVKHLRSVIEKLSNSYFSPSKSRQQASPSPSPGKLGSPGEGGSRHQAFYDRQSEESRLVLAREQAT